MPEGDCLAKEIWPFLVYGQLVFYVVPIDPYNSPVFLKRIINKK